MFFCIPIFFGCQTKLKPESNQAPQICPRCHNASVFPAKKSTWFELFFIPVIPLSSKHILICTICSWQAAVVEQQQAPAGGGNTGIMTDKSIPNLRPAQGWETPNHPGYQPGYIHTPSGSHKQ